MIQSTLQQILYFFGHGFCHQFTERSLEAGGLYFAVCARDTGIYLGFIITLAVLVLIHTQTKNKPTAMVPFWIILLSIGLIIPLAADGASSYLGLRESNNLLRYITGYLAGTGVALLTSGGILSLWTLTNHQVSPVSKPGKTICVLLGSALVGAAFYAGYPYLGALAPFIALGCQWAAVTLVNLLVFSTTPLLPRNASTKRRLVFFLLSVIAAGAEMALFSLIATGMNLLFPWYQHP